MDVKVMSHNTIRLSPDNDSDRAFLELWSEQFARISSSTFINSEATALYIEFKYQPITYSKEK